MDEQTDPQFPATADVQQKQQPSNLSQQTGNTDSTSQQQVTPQPEVKKLSWWKWLIIVLGVFVVAGGVYFFFFR